MKTWRKWQIIALPIIIALSSLAASRSANIARADEPGLADVAQAMTQSQNITIPPGQTVTLGVPCTNPNCDPNATYASAKVTITLVVESFAPSQTDVGMSFFFGDPAQPGCPSFVLTCPRKDFGALPTFQQGALTASYDGYATLIFNNGANPATVALSWSALSASP